MMKVLLLCIGLFSVQVACSITAEEVLNITAGILEGFFHEEKLENFEQCIEDVDKLGYDIYDAVEDFIAGDFEHVRDGIAHIGDAISTIADGIEACKQAVEVDVQKLVEMGEIFTNPKDLIVQIGEDILFNHKSIKADIDNFKKDFAAASWETAGRDIGDAIALVLFGRGKKDSNEILTVEECTKTVDSKNAYLIMAGFAYMHQKDSDSYQSLFSNSDSYSDLLIGGIKSVFEGKDELQTADEVSLMVRELGLVMRLVSTTIAQETGVNDSQFDESNACMSGLNSLGVTKDVMTFAQAATDSYKSAQYKSLGYYIGAIGNKYCKLNPNATLFLF